MQIYGMFHRRKNGGQSYHLGLEEEDIDVTSSFMKSLEIST